MESELQYQPPKSPSPRRGWPSWMKVVVGTGGLVFVFISLSVVADQFQSEFLNSLLRTCLVLATGACFLSPVALLIGLFYMGRQRWTKEDDRLEEEWERRKQQAITLATRIYAQGPVGGWHNAAVRYQSRRIEVLTEKRITFRVDGRGKYQFYRGGVRELYESTFEYVLHAPGVLRVRMTHPPVADAVDVAFEFAVDRAAENEEVLILQLNGISNLPPDLMEFWPFEGEFERDEGQ